MTKGQRDYLADLAARKGVRLELGGDVSAAWASAKIEELKTLPDREFPVLSDDTKEWIDILAGRVIDEVGRWTLQA